jgi:hypothetical protein
MLIVDTPKMPKKILPSLSQEQVECLIEKAKCVRDEAIISLFRTSIGITGSSRSCVKVTRKDWHHSEKGRKG